jgi:pSer/pThr/pTyr-binding forkhead associated (FHA) protein
MLPTIRTEDDNRPRFEYYQSNSPTLRTVYVEQTPFTIGRGEENDLQVNSTSVSREHAELARASGGFQLRDLGSTNGTAVNGREITEAVLQDGDAVRIADVELTFVCSSLGRLQRMVTQPLAVQQADAREDLGGGATPWQRSLNEALLWLAIPIRRDVITDLQFGSPVATITSIDQPLASTLLSQRASGLCSAVGRIQDIAWREAAEYPEPPTQRCGTLLRIEQETRLNAESIVAFQQAQLDCGKQLGVHLPWGWVTSPSNGLAICAQLKSLGAILSLEGFTGSTQCVEAFEPCPPDYLVLAPEVVRDVGTHRRRWQRLEIVQASCEAAGIRTVLPTGTSRSDEQTCQALGIGLRVTPAKSVNAPLPVLAASLI